MKKLLLIISLLLFIPVLNAEENTYFDYPQVSVDTLPTPSSDTLNKVYILGDKYYITSESTGLRTLQLNDNICNKTLYLSIPNNYYESVSTSSLALSVVDNPTNIASDGIKVNVYTNPTRVFVYIGTTTRVYGYYNDSVQVNLSSTNEPANQFTNSQCIVKSLDNSSGILDYVKIDSGTTYSWIQVEASQVFPVVPTKIFVPSNNLYCYHFVDSNTLRGYLSNPVVNSSVNYYDFDLNHHYRQSIGIENITDTPVCLANTTTNYLYREDIVEILIYAFLVGFIVIFIPFKILMSFFKRRF